jgi:hypothetical protein
MKRALECFAVLILAVLIAAVFLPSPFDRPAEPPVSAVDMEMKNFVLAMQSYHSQFGGYPSGENEKILQALLGDNPRQTGFLALAARNSNSSGQFVDPWGTPFHITVDSNVTICSAGPNKVFGDKDDIAHTDQSRAFPKP